MCGRIVNCLGRIVAVDGKPHSLCDSGLISLNLQPCGLISLGKRYSPISWSADKAVCEVGGIVTSPNTKWYAQTGSGGVYTKNGDSAKWVAYGVRDGVRIRAVYEPATGMVLTASHNNDPIPSYKSVS